MSVAAFQATFKLTLFLFRVPCSSAQAEIFLFLFFYFLLLDNCSFILSSLLLMLLLFNLERERKTNVIAEKYSVFRSIAFKVQALMSVRRLEHSMSKDDACILVYLFCS